MNKIRLGALIPKVVILLLIIVGIAFGAFLYAGLITWGIKDTVNIAPENIQLISGQASLPPGTSEEQKLFDRDTTSFFTPSTETTVEVNFKNPINLKHIKVYGPASYYITVYGKTGTDSWSEISGLININLNTASQVWNKYIASSGVTADTFKIKLQPFNTSTLPSNGIAEIEFWANGDRMNIKDGNMLSLILEENKYFSFGEKYLAEPAEDDVVVTRIKEKTNIKEAVFTIKNIAKNSDNIKRAWLIYDIKGIGSWTGIEHTINGKGQVQAWPMAGTTDWIKQMEPINPNLLIKGINEIRFKLPTGAAEGYSIKNLQLVIENDNGFNSINEIENCRNEQKNLLDGDPASAWTPPEENSQTIFNLNKTEQLCSLNLQVKGTIYGNYSISGLKSGQWEEISQDKNAALLTNGWNTINIVSEKVYEKVLLNLTATAGSTGSIAEVAVCGSGVGISRKQDIIVNYPDAGQYYGRAAYITGFLPIIDNGSGVAQVLIGPNPAQINNGNFSGIVSKEDVGLENDADISPWSVDITVLYPDGQNIRKTIKLDSIQQVAAEIDGEVQDDSEAYGFGVKAGKSRKIKIKGIELEIDASDEEDGENIQVLNLNDQDIPPLEMGMVNVTGGGKKAYRFLPHRSKFKKKIRMRLPYDKKRLPPGHKETDIKTYYFNDIINRWLPVEMAQIDKDKQVAECLTDHFTDFINATIVKPDNPQLANFNPNQIKDLKAALPGAGVGLIEPPQVNNKGDAVLSYRIEVPPGRKGMQPEIAITYNSNGGDGLLGFGWDMPIKNVSCDTRWGVPRYDGGKETETYLLEGEMLVPIARTKYENLPARSYGGKRFFSRVEGKFQRIIRRNNITTDYYWEVINKDGSTNLYGTDTSSSYSRLAPVNNKTGHNDIFMWALNRTIDKNGNNIKYYYDSSELSTNNNLLLKHISYTGEGTGDGPFEVYFHYEDHYGATPVNPKIDCRGGFVRKTNKILERIEVKHGSDIIREYVFVYQTGKFGKIRLQNIKQYGKGGYNGGAGHEIVADGHTFTYYDDLQKTESEQKLFSSSLSGTRRRTWNTNIDSNFEKINALGLPLAELPSGISGNINKSSGENYSVVGGIAFVSINDTWGYNDGESKGIYSLMDVNGDGLPDQVFKQRGSSQYKWRPNLGNNGFSSSSYLLKVEDIYSTTDKDISEEFAISKDTQKSTMTGAGLSFGFGPVSIGGSLNSTQVDTIQNKYMTDANADSVPDLVTNGKVYFGKPMERATPGNLDILYDETSGNKLIENNITYNSSLNKGTDNPIQPSAELDTAGLMPSAIELRDDAIAKKKANPLIDTLRRWVAPYSGTIRIDGNIALLNSSAEKIINEEEDYEDDGVYVAIQKNNTELWRMYVPGQQADNNFHDPHVQDNINYEGVLGPSIAVTKGDRIYFRVQSVNDGKYDKVLWDPEVTYTQVDGTTLTAWTNVNNLSETHYKASEDFILAGRRGLATTMMFTGRVKLEGDLVKNSITTDDVTLRILKRSGTRPVVNANGEVQYNADGSVKVEDNDVIVNKPASDGSQTIRWEKFGIDNGAKITMGDNGQAFREIDVIKGDVLALILDCDSNIDLKTISWRPKLTYTYIDPETVPDGVEAYENGNTNSPNFTIYPPYDMIFYPKNVSGTPNTPYIVQSPELKVIPIRRDVQWCIGTIFGNLCFNVYDWANLCDSPCTGSFRMQTSGKVKKIARTSTDVKLKLGIKRSNGTWYEYTVATISKDFVGGCMDPNYSRIEIPGNEADQVTAVKFVLETGSEEDLKSIQWEPGAAWFVNATFTWGPLHFTIANFDMGPAIDALAPAAPYEAKITSTGVSKLRNANFGPSFYGAITWTAGTTPENDKAEVVFTVKNRNQRIFKNIITFEHGTGDQVVIKNNVPYYADFTVGEVFYFECFTRDPKFAVGNYPGKITSKMIDSMQPNIPLYSDQKALLFPVPYRGWAVAGINGNDNTDIETNVNSNSPAREFNEADLEYPDYSAMEPVTITTVNQIAFVPMPAQKPDSLGNTRDMWMASADIYCGPSDMGSSRMGRKRIEQMTLQDIYPPQDVTALPGGKAYGVNRVSKSDQGGGGLSAGIDFGIVNASISGFGSLGDSRALSDYMDMNGDGYPDMIQSRRIQYTGSGGGLSDIISTISNDDLNKTSVINGGGGAGIGGTTINPPVSVPNGGGDIGVTPDSPVTSNTGGQPLSKIGVNVGGSVSGGRSSVTNKIMDINGDGLPDKVQLNGNQLFVRYNTGYGFTGQAFTWASDAINEGASINGSLNASVGINIGVFGASGGVSGSLSTSSTLKTLADVNGDGLPDYIADDGRVRFNTGTGFTGLSDMGIGDLYGNQIGRSESISSGKFYAFSVNVDIVVAKIGGSYSKSLDCQSMGKQTSMLLDMDGDGFPDKVRSNLSNNLDICFNNAGMTNLLKEVNSPMGAKITLEYERSNNTYATPRPRWNLSQVTIEDGVTDDDTAGSDDRIITYDYGFGKYDRLEREFYGYAAVTETVWNGPVEMRHVYRWYNTQPYTAYSTDKDYYWKGLLFQEKIADRNGNINYVKDNRYADNGTGNGIGESVYEDPAPDPEKIVGNNSYFPYLRETEEKYYELSSLYLTALKTYAYDSCGNITTYIDTGSENDLVRAVVTYKDKNGGPLGAFISNPNPPVSADGILSKGPINLPSRIMVYNTATGTDPINLLRHREALYDSSANLTFVKEFLNDTLSADTEMQYDQYGNVSEVYMPENLHGQKYHLNYSYDSDVHTYVTGISDNFNCSSSAVYDINLGKILQTVDVNGSKIDYSYDTAAHDEYFGRLRYIVGPYQGSAPSTHTVDYFYYPEGNSSGIPYAITDNIDPTLSSTPIRIITFTDGLGRVIQTKKSSAVASVTGLTNPPDVDPVMVISGRVEYDSAGRTIRQYYPTVDTAGIENAFVGAVDLTAPPTSYTYDDFDRVLTVTMPDGRPITNTYEIEIESGFTWIKTTVEDVYHNKKITYKNVKQQIKKVKEIGWTAIPGTTNKGNNITLQTSYNYDVLGQLTDVFDHSNNHTQVSYDKLGRRTAISNPDTGAITWVYDTASNVIQKITPELGANSKFIGYNYDFNRLISITYPNNPQNNVLYTYGDNTTGNTKGRIKKVEYGTGVGSQEREYDKLGNVNMEIVKSVRQYGSHVTDTFTTSYTWDNFGRMREIIYDNDDTVTYGYDAGGLVNGVTGIKDGSAVTYVDSIVYDKFGQRLDVKYNNGTGTRYAYNNDDRRLNRLITYDTSLGTKIQDLQYQYDMVGNITNLNNYMAKNMDGPAPESLTRSFLYDGFYRLINGSGELYNVADAANPKILRNFDVSTEFDNIHNIHVKNQSVNIYDPTGAATPYVAKTYNNTYNYNTTVAGNFKPHAPSSIGNKSFTYDRNGNQLGYTVGSPAVLFSRSILWDDADRITRVTDRDESLNTVLTDQQNWYNDAGQRVIKKEGTVETDYINQFTSVRSDTVNLVKVTTNNIFVGNERVISSMDTVNDGTAGDNFMYFYHTDHLGSTGYLTDKDGNLREHMEYTPWGETWLEQVNEELMWNETVHLPNYMFTSKELDAAGLYYFGARYYDPQTSVWASPDPIMGIYLNGKRSGEGIFNLKNLSMYSYSHLNPLILFDPDGRIVKQITNRTWGVREHTFILAIPDDQKAFKAYFDKNKDSDKIINLGTNESPQYGIKIRAGPEGGIGLKDMGKVDNTKNFENDKPDKATSEAIIAAPKKMNDTQFINALIKADENYSKNFKNNYDSMPIYPNYGGALGYNAGDYNSNSYINGILRAVGAQPIDPRKINSDTDPTLYTKPIPEKFFR